MILAAAAIAYQIAVHNFEVHGAPATAMYPAAEGTFPLIVISHGHGGYRLAHHDLIEALARAVFVAAAVDHIGDRVDDVRNPISAEVLSNRPKQISALIDAVLSDEVLAGHVDSKRIGVGGFSAGGFTALVLAGGRPSEQLWRQFCRTHSDQDQACPATAPLVPHPDPRIRAAYAMAPIGFLFDRERLRNVRVPVRIVAGADDRLLPVRENAENVARNLPHRVEVWEIPRAGHYVFVAPCPEDARKMIVEICVDPPGVDRVAIHDEVNCDAIEFFRRVLR